MYERVLVPLDGSDLAETALTHGAAIAEKFGSEIILLRAIRSYAELLHESIAPSTAGSPTGVEMSMDAARTQEESEQQSATAYLDQKRALLSEQGRSVRIEVLAEPPALAILETAEKMGASIIVMSTHGRSGISRAIMGSVADEVVRKSRLPVLLLRPEAP